MILTANFLTIFLPANQYQEILSGRGLNPFEMKDHLIGNGAEGDVLIQSHHYLLLTSRYEGLLDFRKTATLYIHVHVYL